MPKLAAWPVGQLCALAILIFQAPGLAAQVITGYAVIDGTQNPPQLVSATVNVVIADNGSGNYTLTFDQPVQYFLGTSLTQGPGFDAGPTFLTAVQDSLDRRKVNVNIRYGAMDHFLQDGKFSIEVRLVAPPS
jgi:hypothetical protein